jgi:hypothetical protein
MLYVSCSNLGLVRDASSRGPNEDSLASGLGRCETADVDILRGVLTLLGVNGVLLGNDTTCNDLLGDDATSRVGLLGSLDVGGVPVEGAHIGLPDIGVSAHVEHDGKGEEGDGVAHDCDEFVSINPGGGREDRVLASQLRKENASMT